MQPNAALPAHLTSGRPTRLGVWIGTGLIVAWSTAMAFALTLPIDWRSPWPYLLFVLITHLYTGLFITAHDAMHGLVSADARLNRWMGLLCALLFAYNAYPRLLANHRLHHAHPAGQPDPDWHPGGFWPWYISFVRHYVTIWQIAAMALTFNLARLWLPVENLVLFWMVPAILSTFQLFYFGTYQPHKGEHPAIDAHRAVSQPIGHAWAFVSCYFFGYHHEHHAMPWLPWYRLPAARAWTAAQPSATKD